MKYTAEFITPMHPDKICDRISDAVLDFCLSQDPDSRVAVETMGGHGKLYILGEVTTKAKLKNKEINKICKRIAGQKATNIKIVRQSPRIANGVNIGGAGDQGIMIGYATRDNEEFIPQEAYLAKSLAKHIYKKYPYDGKTQITLNDKGEVEAIVASFQNVPFLDLRDEVKSWAEKNIQLKEKRSEDNTRVFINPAGDWEIGGFEADTGLTGRKLAVDNYGPGVQIGGGAFSGKDPSKVDRSGAYMARRIAVDYLKNKPRAKEVLVRLAYAIGIDKPVMATVEIDGKEENIEGYDLSPNGIIKHLELKTPMYEKTAEWGHFGNEFNWDK